MTAQVLPALSRADLGAGGRAACLLHLYREKGCSHRPCNQAVAALRFLYHVTLRRRVASFVIPAARQPSKLPEIDKHDTATAGVEILDSS